MDKINQVLAILQLWLKLTLKMVQSIMQ